MQNDAVKLLVVDDHFVARDGLKRIVALEPDMCVVAEARNGAEAVNQYVQHRPDLVVMDLHMRGYDGVQATAMIRSADPRARILILSSYDTDTDVLRARQAGAMGFVMKEAHPNTIIAAIRTVMAGDDYLPGSLVQTLASLAVVTRREQQILDLLAAGLSRRTIADKLSLGEGTINTYLSGLMKKLGAHNNAEVVFEATRRGMLSQRQGSWT